LAVPLADKEIPRHWHADPGPAGTPIPGPGRIGKGPVSRFPIPANRESAGIGKSPTKNGKTGDPPIPDCSGLGIYSATARVLYHASAALTSSKRLLFRVREREHAAASDEHPSQLLLVQWTRNILSREYHASALTGCQCKRLRLERSPIQGPTEEACWCHLPPATVQGY
jgi:hypothetical protein